LVAAAFGLPTSQLVQGCDEWLDDQGHHRAACTYRLGGHNIAPLDQFQAGLHRILRDLPGVTSTTDKGDIHTHASVDTGRSGAQREQGDIYLKLPEYGHIASVIGHRELVVDVSRKHTHTKAGVPTGRRALKAGADAKYRKHTRPCRVPA